jgi:hypothetical protein
MRNACSILVRKPEGKRTLERPRSRCEDNIGRHALGLTKIQKQKENN